MAKDFRKYKLPKNWEGLFCGLPVLNLLNTMFMVFTSRKVNDTLCGLR